MNKKYMFWIAMAAALFIVLCVIAIWTKNSLTSSRNPVETVLSDYETGTQHLSSQELNTIFEMDKKLPGTRLFYSEQLGLGFTARIVPTYEKTAGDLIITSEGNTVTLRASKRAPIDDYDAYYVDKIEVYKKDPDVSLIQAVQKLGTSRDVNFAKNCEVTAISMSGWGMDDSYEGVASTAKVEDYRSGGCRFMNTDLFIMNKNVPDTFILLQDYAKEGFDIGDGIEKKKGFTGSEYIHDYYEPWGMSVKILR